MDGESKAAPEVEGLDDMDRAIRYVTKRAGRFKMRVIVPFVVVGVVGGFALGGHALMTWHRKLAVVFGFAIPFVTSVLGASLILKVALPRLVARWLAEAAERFGVRRRPLLELLRTTVLANPALDIDEWVKAAGRRDGET